MSSKFVATRLSFRFKDELHDLFIKVTAFLTNLNIELSPLRSGEENIHQKYMITIINMQKLRLKAERVRRSRLKRVPKLWTNIDLMYAVVSESTSSEEEKSSEQTKVNDELAANMDVCPELEEEDLDDSSIVGRSVNSIPQEQEFNQANCNSLH